MATTTHQRSEQEPAGPGGRPRSAPGIARAAIVVQSAALTVVICSPTPRVGELRAVVAEGALWRVPADTAWLPHDLPGLITRGMNWIQAQATKARSGAPEPIALRDTVVAAAPRPILLIAGKDEIRHRAEWEARVVAFLDEALEPT